MFNLKDEVEDTETVHMLKLGLASAETNVNTQAESEMQSCWNFNISEKYEKLSVADFEQLKCIPNGKVENFARVTKKSESIPNKIYSMMVCPLNMCTTYDFAITYVLSYLLFTRCSRRAS